MWTQKYLVIGVSRRVQFDKRSNFDQSDTDSNIINCQHSFFAAIFKKNMHEKRADLTSWSSLWHLFAWLVVWGDRDTNIRKKGHATQTYMHTHMTITQTHTFTHYDTHTITPKVLNWKKYNFYMSNWLWRKVESCKSDGCGRYINRRRWERQIYKQLQHEIA